MLRFIVISCIIFSVFSCGTENPEVATTNLAEHTNVPDTENDPQEKTDMSNPVLIYGSNIGTLFKTYYKVGDFNSMIRYTDKATIERYGRDSLMKIYRKLNLGYDIQLKSMTSEGNVKILHYESSTFATKGVRRLHVVIEDDTARIVPQNLQSGDIFE
jgi:hypothetical protein